MWEDPPMSQATGEDSELLERQYNVRKQVPEYASYLARWQDEANEARKTIREAARASVRVRLDLPYGAAPAERLDLFQAAGSCSPLLIFIHGGYWRALDKEDFSWIAPPYLASGFSVAVVNYGKIPDTPLQQIVEQIRRACAWLYHNARVLEIDRDQMVCSGHSAGGHLTAMMLATDWPGAWAQCPQRLLSGAVIVSGLFDLEPLSRAPFLSGDLRLDPVLTRALSPAYLQLRNDAPMLRAVGQAESAEFHRQSALIAQHWPQACERALIELSGCNHFSACDALSDPDSALFQETAGLLSR
jgi:arylformamidase